jgi:hypothetical protein
VTSTFPLDTNKCSWSHGRVTNTCSVRTLPTAANVLAFTGTNAYEYGYDYEWEAPTIGLVKPGAGASGRTRTSAAVIRRRVLLGAAALAMLVLLALPWGGTGGRSLATPGAARGGSLQPGAMYVVRPGDTVWGIAERIASNGNVQPVVAKLEAEIGGDSIQPGQVIRLP